MCDEQVSCLDRHISYIDQKNGILTRIISKSGQDRWGASPHESVMLGSSTAMLKSVEDKTKYLLGPCVRASKSLGRKLAVMRTYTRCCAEP
jgi:hypothetical protein